MAFSSDGTVLLASDLLMDEGLAVFGDLTYVDRDVWLALAVYGQKLNTNGSLVFQPLTNGIDVLDGTTGLLQCRVTLPLTLPNVYDALAIDDTDNLLFAITATGIAQVNPASLPVASSDLRRVNSSTRTAGRSPEPFGHAPGQADVQNGKVAQRGWLCRPLLRHEHQAQLQQECPSSRPTTFF